MTDSAGKLNALFDQGCIGCGCKHDETDPRNIDTILKQADDILLTYRDKSAGGNP